MFSAIAGWQLKRMMARTRAGDIEPTVQMYADDVVFRFPGSNSWSGEYHGREAVRTWLQRLADLGLQTFADEVLLQGWPWRMTMCVRGTDTFHADGQLVYENRYVIWGHLRWGRITDYEVYEDTEKPATLDEWIEAHRPELAVAA